MYKYLPKKRHREEEEEECDRETTSDSANETITLSNECIEKVATTPELPEHETDHTHHRIQPIEPNIGSVDECDDISSTPECSPCQPANIQFPVTYFSGKARSYNSEWFRQYLWLEYSAYCYPCCLFGSTSICTSRPEKPLNTSGFHDWKHATGSKGILLSHNKCICHKQVVVAWEQFKATSKTGSFVEQLGSHSAEQIKKNRHYIKTVAEVLLIL